MPQTPERLTVDDYKNLFAKFPPQTDQEKLYASVILSIAERADRLDTALRFLAGKVARLEKGGDAAEPLTAEGATKIEDKTPFPEGVSPTVPKPDVQNSVASKPMPIPQPVPGAPKAPAVQP